MALLETSAITDEERVTALADALLRDVPPRSASASEFLGAQFDRGLAWVHFPEGHGGLGLNPKLQKAVDDRLFAAGAPNPVYRNPIGHGMCGPTVVAWGTEDQKRRYLRPLFTGEEIWCQLFSEPGSGSDFAGLSSRGVRDGDEWVVNGQKVWTTLAHLSRWGLLVVRTDSEAVKHAGLTAFVVDMHDPTVEVRPLRQMTGEAEFNEVFFDQVRVPRANVVGRPGDGWKIAMGILAHERGPMWAFMFHGYISEDLSNLIALAKRRGLDADPRLRERLARAWTDVEVMRLLGSRSLTAETRGEPIGPKTSLEKLFGSELSQRLRDLTMDVLGAEGLLGMEDSRADWEGRWQRFWLFSRADTIMGGTSEIQRQVIAHQLLGLPR